MEAGHVGNGESKSMNKGTTVSQWRKAVIVSGLRTVILCTFLRFLEKFPEKKILLWMPT